MSDFAGLVYLISLVIVAVANYAWDLRYRRYLTLGEFLFYAGITLVPAVNTFVAVLAVYKVLRDKVNATYVRKLLRTKLFDWRP